YLRPQPRRKARLVGIALLTLGACLTRTTVAQTIVADEALIQLPPSANWNMVVNFRPGDGETVSLNPPRFSWTYSSTPSNSDNENNNNADISPKEFLFQISSNSYFTN